MKQLTDKLSIIEIKIAIYFLCREGANFPSFLYTFQQINTFF